MKQYFFVTIVSAGSTSNKFLLSYSGVQQLSKIYYFITAVSCQNCTATKNIWIRNIIFVFLCENLFRYFSRNTFFFEYYFIIWGCKSQFLTKQQFLVSISSCYTLLYIQTAYGMSKPTSWLYGYLEEPKASDLLLEKQKYVVVRIDFTKEASLHELRSAQS